MYAYTVIVQNAKGMYVFAPHVPFSTRHEAITYRDTLCPTLSPKVVTYLQPRAK